MTTPGRFLLDRGRVAQPPEQPMTEQHQPPNTTQESPITVVGLGQCGSNVTSKLKPEAGEQPSKRTHSC